MSSVVSDSDVHQFLLDTDGELHNAMYDLSALRSHIESLPETAATFRLSTIDCLHPPQYTDEHLEFLLSWPVHEIYASKAERMYVNPSYAHAHRYTDAIVECECGTQFTRNYEDDSQSLQNEHDHDVTCLPQWRLTARAQMAEQRQSLIVRLSKLGWRGADIAARLGLRPTGLGTVVQQYAFSMKELYAEYHRLAANTWWYLTEYRDTDRDVVADIYGHCPDTLVRWSQKYRTLTESALMTENDPAWSSP